MELKQARALNRQVYVFVFEPVLYEYATYKKNRQNVDVLYHHVDDRQVFVFLDEVHAYAQNNPIAPFKTSQDIMVFLREQWGGLFQRFLREKARRSDVEFMEKMNHTAETLNKLVEFLTAEKRDSDNAIKTILLTTHPVFEELRRLTKTPYRIYFETFGEMEAWLRVRSFVRQDDLDLEHYQYQRNDNRVISTLRVRTDLFDESNRLRPAARWSKDLVTLTETAVPQRKIPDDDEIPF